jgi:hypothetical protein
MVANGDATKKIWITECGWVTYTNAADASAVGYARQAHYLTNLFTRLASYPYVEVGCWYTSRSFDETQHEGSFGLMLPDFTRKPSFYAFKDWVAAASRTCPPAFINLSALTPQPDGSMRIDFAASAGFSYTVLASSNLSIWSAIATNLTGTNGAGIFTDFEATNFDQRFYRVVWP